MWKYSVHAPEAKVVFSFAWLLSDPLKPARMLRAAQTGFSAVDTSQDSRLSTKLKVSSLEQRKTSP